MDNPYESPQPVKPDFGGAAHLMSPSGRPRGMVGHVRVLGILMIVHGIIVLLFGLFLIGMGIFFGIMFSTMPPPNGPRGPNGPSPEVFGWIMGGVYMVMGLCGAIPGALQAYAGWKNYNFRSRQLGLISLFAGFVSLATCYCIPTAIGMSIYGLIVLFDGSVAEAFALGEQGHTPEQIDMLFSPYGAHYAPNYPPNNPPSA